MITESGAIDPQAIAVVIPTFNRVGELLDCLRSIEAQRDVTIRAFVVDDGSSDGTAEQVRAAFPRAEVLRGDGHLWWSGATNLGVQAALRQGYRWIMLLNDDNVLDRNAAATLLDYAQRHPGTIVGSLVLVKGSNRIGYAGAGVNWLRGGPYLKDTLHDYRGQYRAPIAADFLGGQGVLIERAIFDRIGLFDARVFPQYYGDADFYLRARRRGVRVVVHPASVVWDGLNESGFPRYGFRRGLRKLINAYTSRRSAVNLKDTTRFFVRHCPPWLLPIALPRKVLGFAKSYVRAQLA